MPDSIFDDLDDKTKTPAADPPDKQTPEGETPEAKITRLEAEKAQEAKDKEIYIQKAKEQEMRAKKAEGKWKKERDAKLAKGEKVDDDEPSDVVDVPGEVQKALQQEKVKEYDGKLQDAVRTLAKKMPGINSAVAQQLYDLAQKFPKCGDADMDIEFAFDKMQQMTKVGRTQGFSVPNFGAMPEADAGSDPAWGKMTEAQKAHAKSMKLTPKDFKDYNPTGADISPLFPNVIDASEHASRSNLLT